MTIKHILYILPYLFSATLSLFVAIYSWRRREVPGAKAYGTVAALQATMTIGFLFELLSPYILGKIFWDDFQWLVLSMTSVLYLGFCVEYTDYKVKRPIVFWGMLSIAPILLIILVMEI